MRNYLILTTALTVLLGTSPEQVAASTCSDPSLSPSNPDSVYTYSASSPTVTDTRNGLIWKRCSEGQTWSGGICTGVATTHSWSKALALSVADTTDNADDWRVPNVKELRSLVEECSTNPALNAAVFPAVPAQSWYWTSSAAVLPQKYKNYIWAVSSDTGVNASFTGGSTRSVRLVRGGDNFDTQGVPAVPQTITFPLLPTTIKAGATITASATTTSPLTVTYTSSTPTTCSVNGNLITGLKVGECTVAANQKGGTGFLPATSVSRNTTVQPGDQTIAVTFSPISLTAGTTTTVSGVAHSGPLDTGNFVSFQSATPSICSVSGSVVTGIAVGLCIVNASAAGSTDFVATTTPSQESIPVTKGALTIGTISFEGSLMVGTTTTAGATLFTARMTDSGLAVVFSSITPSICSVLNNTTVRGLTTGVCTIAANYVGDDNFFSATEVTQPILVMDTQSIVGFNPAPLTVGVPYTLSPSVTDKSLPITYYTDTPSVCSVNGTTVTVIAFGNCTIYATQKGAGFIAPAQDVVRTIPVGRGIQNIGSISLSPTLTAGNPSALSPTTTSSGLAVSFVSNTEGACIVSGNNVIGKAAGTGNCSITASQSGNSNFSEAAPVTQSFDVGIGNQTIALSFSPNGLALNGTTTVTATASSNLPVILASATPATCSLSGSGNNTITAIPAAIGLPCIITGDQAGDGVNYNAAPTVSKSFAIMASSQTISFDPVTLTVGNLGKATASATATSNLNVIFTSTPSGICTVSGTNGATITAAHVGTCTIAANQAGNSTFAAAPQVTQDVSVGKGSQTISNLSFSTTNLAPNGTTTVNATNSSILPVTFASATAPICTVSGNTVTAAAGVTSGTCYITARQDGNTDYLEATPRGLNISVGITQTIGSLSLTPNLRVGITSTVSAPITSGLTISFNSLTPSKCTVSGSTVTGVAVGTCTLSADQFGNATYAPAAQVKQNFVVAAATGNSSSLTNISTRGPVQTGNNVMIGGFIISGSTPKTVLVRARGPSLTAFGVANPVANPTVSLYSGTTVIASNDNWASPVTVAGGSAPASQAAIQATLQAPTNSLESAILTTLPPGTYTAIMSGVGGTGVGIVEVLEIDHPESPLINISTRGPVQTGDNVMIGGFVINGSTPQTVLITARGPSLASAGLTGLLANPTMNLYSGTTVIASNDNWATPVAVAGGSAPASQAAIQATGQAPTYPLESAILTTLQPGSYTVIVQGVGNTTGLAIVEVNAQ